VGLSRAGSGIHLEQVLFSPPDHKIYLRATGSNDIYVVTLTDAPQGGATSGASDGGLEQKNDFTPSVNQLAAGVAPSDMMLYTDGDPPSTRLLVTAPGSQQAIVIEPNSSNVTSVALPLPADHVVLYRGPKPGSSDVALRALLYSPSTTGLTFLDLKDVESRGALNVDTLTVQEPYASALALSCAPESHICDRTVMLIHTSTGLSQLDLYERTVTEIQGPNLLSATPDPANQKLWVAANDRVAFLDFTQGAHPDEVRVDAPIEKFLTVPFSAKAQHRRVAVTHASSLGWLTVLDATNPKVLSEDFSVRGFLVSDALNGGGL
jgi:hypothetical protein